MNLVIPFAFLFFCFISLTGQEREADHDWRKFFRIGIHHFENERYENAAYYFENADQILARTNNATTEERAKLYNFLGTAYARLNNEDKAAQNYLYSIEYLKTQHNALKYLADYYLKRKRFKLAIDFYNSYLTLQPADKSALLDLARSYAFSGNRDKAKLVLAQTGNPESEQIKNCEKIFYLKDYSGAVACYGTLRKEFPGYVNAHLALVNSLLLFKKNDEAEKAAETLYILFGDNTRYIWVYADLVHKQKKFPLAIKLLDEIIRLDISDNTAKQLKEMIIKEKGKYKDLKKDPTANEIRLYGH